MHFTRREFCTIAGSTVASIAFGSACSRIGGSIMSNDGRLILRPHGGATPATGRIMLGLDQRARYASRTYLTNPKILTQEGEIKAATISLILDRAVYDGIHDDFDIHKYYLHVPDRPRTKRV